MLAVHQVSERSKKQYVLMATTLVDAARSNGANVMIRILLDSVSEANFVRQSTCNTLGVKRNKTSEVVTGLNEMESQVDQSCDIVPVTAVRVSNKRSLFSSTDNYEKIAILRDRSKCSASFGKS